MFQSVSSCAGLVIVKLRYEDAATAAFVGVAVLPGAVVLRAVCAVGAGRLVAKPCAPGRSMRVAPSTGRSE
jgi:hypothetical protein